MGIGPALAARYDSSLIRTSGSAMFSGFGAHMKADSPSAEMFRMLRAAGCDTNNEHHLQMGMIAYNIALLAWNRRNLSKTGIVQPAAKSRAGRNDPCPCGSGKKFKKCCLHKNRAPSADPHPHAKWALDAECLPRIWDVRAVARDCAILNEIMDRDPAFANMCFSSDKVTSFMDAIIKEDPTFLKGEKADIEEKIDGLAARYVRESGEGKVGEGMKENVLAAIPRAQSKDEIRALATGLCFAFMQEASVGTDDARDPEASLTDTILFRRALLLGMQSAKVFSDVINQLGEDTEEVVRKLTNNDPSMSAKIQSCVENLSPSEKDILRGSFEQTCDELWNTIRSGNFPVPLPFATQLAYFLKFIAEAGSAGPSEEAASASLTAFCDELIEEDYVLYSRMLGRWLKDCKKPNGDAARAVRMMQGFCAIRYIKEFVPGLIVNSIKHELFVPFEASEQRFIEQSMATDCDPDLLLKYGEWLTSKGFPAMAARLRAFDREDARQQRARLAWARKPRVA